MFVCTGECHVSPAVLAGMWREEEAKCKNLEEKMKAMLKGRGVGMIEVSGAIWHIMYCERQSDFLLADKYACNYSSIHHSITS